MKILFDHGTPRPLRDHLTGHQVTTAAQMGWDRLRNGALLAAAEPQFDLLLTTDKSIRYQQNLAGRRLAILVLPLTNWNVVQFHTREVLEAVNKMQPGEYVELTW